MVASRMNFASKPIGGPQRRNHLGDALSRVMEVCQLAP